MAAEVTVDESGNVIEAVLDEVITDPNSPDAVQIPDGVDGADARRAGETRLDRVITDPNSAEAVQIPDGVEQAEHPLAVHNEPSPEEVFAAAAEAAARAADDESEGKVVNQVQDTK